MSHGCAGDKIEKNEMGGTCDTYRGRERCAQGFGGETCVDQDTDGRIILRWIFRKWGRGCGDWIELAEDRDKWQALVSTVMNFGVP